MVWRLWKIRLPTNDNLKRYHINIVSRCYCCEIFQQEDVEHLFLIASIALQLWRFFAAKAGIDVRNSHLQQVFIKCWKMSGSTKIQQVFKVVPMIIVWELWKRRNARRHGKELSISSLIYYCQNSIYLFVRKRYPGISIPTDWEGIISVLQEYKPKLYYYPVTWTMPEEGWSKCNTDGASKGNPRISSYAFYIRDYHGNLEYAEAKVFRVMSNMEAEVKGFLFGLEYCKRKGMDFIIMETDSLVLQKCILKEWKIPWQISKNVDKIISIISHMTIRIYHTFREANQPADTIANLVLQDNQRKQFNNFQELPMACRRVLNADKQQLSTLRIKSRRIISPEDRKKHSSNIRGFIT